MQVTDANNVKIYNLSAGKSLPDWLSEQKRRKLLKKNLEIRRRIELIQDFDMPAISTSVKMSRDGQYAIATGIYKPRVKCFDVNNLSLKFERCFDSDVVTFEILSDDYSKMVFLHSDRFVEFHAAHGRYHRLRIPRFGRDMKYNEPNCDLLLAGDSPDIYRLNLERGQFLTPYTTQASAINSLAINPVHNLIVCGTQEGRLEAWDHRERNAVGHLDCAFNCVNESQNIQNNPATFPSISTVKFENGLILGVGTTTGQVLLYDIRSNKPFLIKDHMYGLPIKDIDFHHQQNIVYSMDSSILKIWDKDNGKLFTSIESNGEFNNLCVVPGTGMLFIANEGQKIQTYYIPRLGPAPRWAAFLDSLTEELEESNSQIVYDDYKFVTKNEIEALGLDHLFGTNLLRAYMHGYFIDMRLYRKAKSVVDPFAFEDYRKKKVREKIENDRVNRVQVHKLPQVNKTKALEILSQTKTTKSKTKPSNLLQDDRFKQLFENPEFEIQQDAEEFRSLNPVLSKQKGKNVITPQFEPIEEEQDGSNSEDDDSSVQMDDSSDDDHTWTKEVKQQYRKIENERREQRRQEAQENETTEKISKPRFYQIKDGEEFSGFKTVKRKTNRSSLGERLHAEANTNIKVLDSVGNREMTFSTFKGNKVKRMQEFNKKHRAERQRFVRPANSFKFKRSNKK